MCRDDIPGTSRFVDELRAQAFGPPHGDRWHPTAVARLLNRLQSVQSTSTHV
jgi:hypothetical protein